MSARKIPLRKCIACNEMKPKKKLIRIVKNKDNEVKVDLTGKANGRGAYICPTVECFDKGYNDKKIQKALQVEVAEEIYSKLKEIINE